MIALALLLGTFGAADLVRSRDSTVGPGMLLRSLAVGTTVLALGIWGASLPWWWGVVGLVLLVLWTTTTSLVLTKPRIHPWPLVGFALVIATILSLNSVIPSPHGWMVDWYASLGFRILDGVGFERFALAAASFLFLCESANIIVRMVISGSDKQLMSSEMALKGGRILGPIERIFILAMGLSGELLAVAAIVAAKSILRFPEISGDKTRNKAEYVLVGSFVSWGIALLCLPLLK